MSAGHHRGPIDWSTLVRLDGSFVDKALEGRRTDMLFSTRMGSVSVFLYVLSEHKSKDERFLPSHVRERLAAADAEALQQWGLRVLTATRIDEVFADS